MTTDIEKQRSFEKLWREYFSLIPPLDTMNLESREKLKDFTRKVYDEAVHSINVKDLIDNAYDDGVKSGQNEIRQEMVEKLSQVLEDIKS